jgi:hypothetical protein
LCRTVRTNGKSQDNPDQETSTDKAQIENNRIKNIPVERDFSHPSIAVPMPIQPHRIRIKGLIRRGKAAEAWRYLEPMLKK